MRKVLLLVGLAIGFVLGAKAGRGRYERIRARAATIARDVVDKTATTANDVAGRATDVAKDVAHRVSDTADDVKERVTATASEVRERGEEVGVQIVTRASTARDDALAEIDDEDD